MNNKLELIIKKSLDLFDEQNMNYVDYIKSTNINRTVTIKDAIFSDNVSNTDSDSEAQQSITQQTKSDDDIDHEARNIIYFNENASFNYEILGLYDIKTRVWAWSWSFPLLQKAFTYESRQLLNYALDKKVITLEDQETLFIKTQLTNSRLSIPDSFQLDILLSLCSYLLQQRIKFIYPEVNKENSNIILFILVK